VASSPEILCRMNGKVSTQRHRHRHTYRQMRRQSQASGIQRAAKEGLLPSTVLVLLPSPLHESPVVCYSSFACTTCPLLLPVPRPIPLGPLQTVVNRPLAGTRRRGGTPEEDLALERELLADERSARSTSCSWTWAGTTWGR